jgi:trimethylamine--corrinoid protein Co-methyltransferase
VELIQQVGIGGSFIAAEHTLRHMRNTYWRASIFNQAGWDAWKANGGKDVYARAHEVVESILAKNYPPQPVINGKAIADLDRIIAQAKAHPERFAL